MIEYIKYNLFNHEQQVIVHGCNAVGVMGSGFAKELRSKYPECYTKYHNFCNSYKNTSELMGRVCYWHGSNITIANCITQEKYGRDGNKYVSYDAINDSMKDIYIEFSDINPKPIISMPKIGAGLGGGDWSIIEPIIKLWLDKEFHMRIYEL